MTEPKNRTGGMHVAPGERCGCCRTAIVSSAVELRGHDHRFTGFSSGQRATRPGRTPTRPPNSSTREYRPRPAPRWPPACAASHYVEHAAPSHTDSSASPRTHPPLAAREPPAPPPPALCTPLPPPPIPTDRAERRWQRRADCRAHPRTIVPVRRRFWATLTEIDKAANCLAATAGCRCRRRRSRRRRHRRHGLPMPVARRRASLPLQPPTAARVHLR